jgi:large subunit ribosomal protein L9
MCTVSAKDHNGGKTGPPSRTAALRKAVAANRFFGVSPMEVILIDNVYELGRRGEVIKVSDGYGRNYLIPRKLAIPATPSNLRMVEEQRIALAKKEAKFVEEAELLEQQLGQMHLLISRKSGETGSLFGSVTSKDVAEALDNSGIKIDRRKILVEQPIKTIGNFSIEIRFHSDVEAKLLLSVIPEAEEPVCRIIQRGEESDQFIAEVEAKLEEISGTEPEEKAD